jgi:hypothetical protein
VLAAVELTSARATAWDPQVGPIWWRESRVRAIVVDGPTIYVGGDFRTIGGALRNSVAALETKTGRATVWDAALGPGYAYIGDGNWDWPYVGALALQGHTLFIGGWFEQAGGAPRTVLAAVDSRTGRAESFDAQVQGGEVRALAVQGHTLYAAGGLYGIGGAVRVNLAALDSRTGQATEWNPRADGMVRALAMDGNVVFAGGSFTSVYDWQVRYGVAALDLTTGALEPWDAHMDGGIWSLAVMGNTLYMIGGFRTVGGQTRGNLAAVDATTGAVLPWAPGYGGGGYPATPTLAAQDGVVYLGGLLIDPGGTYHWGITALDGATGAVIWTPAMDPGAIAEAVLPAGSTVYVSGYFNRISGQPRTGLAALDAATGQVLPWAPQVGDGPHQVRFLDAMAMRGDTLYIGGTLGSVRGEARSDLAAVDARTGNALPWDPEVGGEYMAANEIHVSALAAEGNTVWAGGEFATVGGLPHSFLAALDATTGTPTDWRPNLDGHVYALLASGDTLYVGGSFRTFDGLPRSGLAAVMLCGASVRAGRREPPPAPLRAAAVLSDVFPNPVRGATAIRFSLREAGRGSLAVYDIQGRRVVSLLDGAPLPAGDHELTLRTQGWAPGVYLYRLEAAGTVLTHKLVVTQ